MFIGNLKREREREKKKKKKEEGKNVRYYLHIWPICYIYGVYYIYCKYNIRYYGYDNFY